MTTSTPPPGRRAAAGLGVSALALLAAAASRGRPAAAQPAAPGAVAPATVALPPPPRERSVGRPDAPVTVTEFHSITCGNCANFHNNILPRVKAELVDTGRVRMVYRDFPLDRVALDAASMAHAVGGESDERWAAVVGTLYAAKDAWAHSPDPRAYLRRVGLLAGAPGERLDAAWTDAYQRPILEQRLDAQREFNVNATPTFVIGGRVIPGVIQFDRFAEFVRQAAAAPASPRG